MSHVLHRSLLQTPTRAVRGDGLYIVDHKGKRYLDGCGGAAVSCLGHNHPRVIAAIQEQVATLPYAHTAFFTTDKLEQLADRLVDTAPGMDKVLLLSGGSEAVEAALKLSRQFFVDTERPTKKTFIARRQSYHGNTLGALAVGGNEWRREKFRPLLATAHHIAPCYSYRDRQNSENEKAYGERVAAELEAKILELGAENVAAFVAETVVGATIGAVEPVEGYFSNIRSICDRYDVHLILDEVMCGAGRTGTQMSYSQENISPDIVTMAKGLAAGYQPIGATLCTAEISDAIQKRSGYFQHGHTFMGHATAVAAALETQAVIKDDDLLDNVKLRGASLKASLQSAFVDNPHVGDVRGRGLLIGVEFVRDRDSKQALHPADRVHKKVQEAAMQLGLLCYSMGGTIDGRQGDHVLIAPPFILEPRHETELVEKFVAAVNAVLLE